MRRASVLGAVAVAVVAATVATPAHATPASPKPKPSVTVQTATVAFGETPQSLVVGQGVTANKPVTIAWGDGSSDTATTNCRRSRAAAKPARCTIDATHTCASPGVFTVTASIAGETRAEGTVTVTAPSPPPIVTDSWRQEMLDQVNTVRQAAGSAPLRMCPALQTAAQNFATYQAEANFYSHTGPDGSTQRNRVEAAGYGGWRGLAENIYKSPRSVTAAVDGWVASPGHYTNLINPAYTDVGFGFAENPDTPMGTYWVQNFGVGGTC